MINKYLPEGSLISTPENNEYVLTLAGLEKARNEGKILEGIASRCDSQSLTLHVDLNGIDGIIEKNECLFGAPIKDIAIITRVGKSVSFKVMQIINGEGGKPKAILSRKEAQRECLENYLLTLAPGDIIPAKLTHLEVFGAFLDIGCGISSLMTVDSVSVSRIDTPAKRFLENERLDVLVKSIDYENSRIYVSTRELFGTWEENAALFSPGQTVPGVVRSIEDYGIFVELAPNLAGLAEYHEDLTVGQCCAVYIKSIIPEKMKVKLVIIDTYDFAPDLKHPTYFIDTNSIKHMDYWRYSPDSCKKLVETVF